MNNRIKYFIYSLVAVVSLAVVVAGPPEKGPIEKCGEKKAAVTFDHATHTADNACVTCHHTQEDLTAESTDIEVEACRKCHLEPQGETLGTCADMSPAKNPYHKTCITCHKAKAKEGETTAPTKCDGCHPKA